MICGYIFFAANSFLPCVLYTQNFVTWRIIGTPLVDYSKWLGCNSHFRIWNILRGKSLDVSSIWGDGSILYTTSIDGTFKYRIEYIDPITGDMHWVELFIDGPKAWWYSLRNKYGVFEFAHKNLIRYMLDEDAIMLDFAADYGSFAPRGVANIEQGSSAIIRSVIQLSNLRGNQTKIQDQEACGVLNTYVCEPMKLREAQGCLEGG